MLLWCLFHGSAWSDDLRGVEKAIHPFRVSQAGQSSKNERTFRRSRCFCIGAIMARPMRKLTALVLGFLMCTASCGGGTSALLSTGISGAYEFVVTSNVTGGTTLVEADFEANGSQSSATGPSRAQVLTYENKIWYINGVCAGAMPGQNSVLANVSGNNRVALTFNVGGNVLTSKGSLTGDTISGNYSLTGSNCPDLVGIIGYPAGYDIGGFIGNPVPDLAGTFAGVLNLRVGVENATLTLQPASDHSLTVQAKLTGTEDNGDFTFTGSAVGNIMFVSGSVNGRALSWLGYYDRTGHFTGIANSMLVFDHDNLSQAGLLLKQ